MSSRNGYLGILLSLAMTGVTLGQDVADLTPPSIEALDQPAEGDDSRLLGLFLPTDTNFNDFISPTSNPVFFEDPRNVTEAKMVFFNHNFPGALGGQDMQVYQLQLRA